MNTSVRAARIFLLAALSVWLSAPAPGGTNGTLSGRVTDLKTGEPLPLVNILIVGSGRGSVTNDKGDYTVTQIPAGVYAIRVSLLGYKTTEAKRITIDADKTTVFNFKLAGEDIELEGVTVEGKAPIVDVRKTSSDQTYGTDKIEQLPNVKDVGDVLGVQAGVVKFGDQLFLRGGRANETQILVDGVVVNDASGTAAANQELQALYTGSSTGGGGLGVSAAAIQSVSVSAGGLDGEFGNAQSGVVNISTKSGNDTYGGSVEFRSDGIMSEDFGERYYAFTLGGPEPITMSLLPALGLEIPGKLTFFLTGSFNQFDGANPYNVDQFYNPVRRTIDMGLFDFTYTDKQQNNSDFNFKLSYLPGESDLFTARFWANTSSSHPISGSYGYYNRSDSSASSTSYTKQYVVQWTHFFGTTSELRGYITRRETESQFAVRDLDPPDYAPVSRDPNGDGFTDLGNSQRWNYSEYEVWNAKVNFTSQVHESHRVKAGFEYFAEGLRSTNITSPTDPLRPVYTDARGEWPGYGFARWVSNNYPSRGALWLQDDIEFGRINISLILRYDFLYLGKQVFDPDYIARWEDVTNLEAGWLDNESFWSQFADGYFSPRFRIGYPISTETVFYFNYGHFTQIPELTQFFRDPISTTLANNWVGNPALKPQKTISYEAGFDQAIFSDFSLGVRGYYKDIFDYASFRRLQVTPTVDVYTNLDYASTRGFEIILRKDLSDHYFGSVNYTYQLAKGRSSDPRAAQNSPALFGLPREVRLDYDQQHTLNVYFGYSVGPREDFELFGIPLNYWTASIAWSYGSGFPYTPYNQGRTLSDLYLLNTGDGPYVSQLDISLTKGFRLFSNLSLVLRLDVKNLLNRRNVDLSAGGFNSLTGRVTEYGDYDPSTLVLYPWEAGGTAFDVRVPPYAFLPPRQILFGIKLNWD
jgi:outer membrane receptor protein involved in Fe transport